jgi:hypothetical protein
MHKTLAEPFTGAHIHPIPVIDRPDEVPAGQPEAVRTGQHGATEVLHVGCGPYHPAALPPVFRHAGWREIRLDIDPGIRPDVVASITDMRAIADSQVGRLCRCVRRPQHLAHWVRLLRRGINLEITWFRQSFS